MESPAARIIRLFGGISATQKALGHRWPSRVQGWKERGIIPAREQPKVLNAAHARNIPLTPADFFDLPAAPAPEAA